MQKRTPPATTNAPFKKTRVGPTRAGIVVYASGGGESFADGLDHLLGKRFIDWIRAYYVEPRPVRSPTANDDGSGDTDEDEKNLAWDQDAWDTDYESDVDVRKYFGELLDGEEFAIASPADARKLQFEKEGPVSASTQFWLGEDDVFYARITEPALVSRAKGFTELVLAFTSTKYLVAAAADTLGASKRSAPWHCTSLAHIDPEGGTGALSNATSSKPVAFLRTFEHLCDWLGVKARPKDHQDPWSGAWRRWGFDDPWRASQ